MESPRPLPPAFVVNERLEHPLSHRLGDAFPLIAHLQHDAAAHEVLGLRRQLVGRELRGFDSNFSAGRRRLHCIEEEIEDRAMKQIIIANDDQRS